ncbi:hypothetical protein [Streptomyces sp. NPDC008150]|uniref:hypothetical protein n=1 Tax=Streptomyces sp. NPDC008150 TaxID=3364816 RepID=UPI0036E8A507
MTDQPNTPRPNGLSDLLAAVAEHLPQNDPDRCTETLASMPVTAPQPLTPDEVNAIVRDMDDPRYPSRITVFCDRCGVENTGEYMVREGMTSRERLAVARNHLVNNEGWEHDEFGSDFCPAHAGSRD